MLKNKLIYLIVFCFCLLNAKTEELNQLLNSKLLKSAHVGWLLIDLYSGDTISSYQHHKSFNSASLMKLVTVASALELNLDRSTLDTKASLFAHTNGSHTLNINSSNDFSFGSEYISITPDEILKQLVQFIQQHKVEKLNVNLVTPQFEGNKIPPGYLWEDIGNYYGAQSAGFFWRDNKYSIFLKSSAPSSKTKVIATQPVLSNITFKNKAVASKSSKDSAYIFGSYLSQTRTIEGSIPSYQKRFRLKGSIGNPKKQFLFELKNELNKIGISVSKEASIAKGREIDQITLCSTKANTLYQLCLQKSLNHYAEGILLQINKDSILNRDKSLLLEQNLWTNLHCAGVAIKDGSGLSPHNRLTPIFVVEILTHFNKQESNKLKALMPLAGKEGTVKYMFRNAQFKANLKSGSMQATRNYAGYIQTKDNKNLALCLCINGYTGTPKESVLMAEKIITALINTK